MSANEKLNLGSKYKIQEVVHYKNLLDYFDRILEIVLNARQLDELNINEQNQELFNTSMDTRQLQHKHQPFIDPADIQFLFRTVSSGTPLCCSVVCLPWS